MQIEFHMAVKQKNWKDISIRTKSAKKQLALIYKNAQSTLEKKKLGWICIRIAGFRVQRANHYTTVQK